MDAGVDPEELAELRRGAYGPDAALDAAALARLQHLEDLVRESASRAASADTAPGDLARGDASGDPAAAPRTRDPVENRVDESPTPDTARTRPRWLWVGAAAAVALALGIGVVQSGLVPGPLPDAATAPAPTSTPGHAAPADRAATEAEQYVYRPDPSQTVLLRVPLDGSFGSYVDLPPTAKPRSLRAGDTAWSEPLGTYYGWELWIARGIEGSACTVLRRGDDARGGCLSEDAIGSVAPALGYGDIDPEQRPDGMDPGTSIFFWWLPGEVAVVLSPAP